MLDDGHVVVLVLVECVSNDDGSCSCGSLLPLSRSPCALVDGAREQQAPRVKCPSVSCEV